MLRRLLKLLRIGHPSRLIFRFKVGGRKYAADPLVIDRELQKAGGDDWHAKVIDVAGLRREMPQEFYDSIGPEMARQRREKFRDDIEKLVAWSRSAFDLPPIGKDGRGVTDAEVLIVLADYLDFANELAEDVRPFVVRPGR